MDGKIIIIGATGYTGSALAKLLKQENIDCHLIGRNESELEKLANETEQSFSVCRDRKSTRLNSSHIPLSRMPSSA